MQSLSFDRAADFYDETRGHSPEISRQIATAAVALLPGDRPVLEIGIGTGRIARPLLARGVRLSGIDLSERMMARLRANLPANLPPPSLTKADAAYQPFARGKFGAVISVHVFHLIAEWPRAIQEILRVLQPGGIYLNGYDWREAESPMAQIREKWRQIVWSRINEKEQPGASSAEHQSALEATGARLQEVTAAGWEVTFQPEAYLRALENGIYSSSWRLPPEELPAAIEELSGWAESQFGALDREFRLPRKFIWQCYRWD